MNIINKIKKWANYDTPAFLTMEGWNEFGRDFKTKAPIRYFLFHKLPIKISTFKRKYISDPIYWVKYRTTDKYHIVKTGLSPNYYETDYLMLHVNFNLLKEFVEIECARLEDWQSRLGYWQRIKEKFLGYRSKKSGIAHLTWASSLGKESPSQAKAAKELLELYTWWTDIRPNRQELPLPVYAQTNDDEIFDFINDVKSPEETKYWKEKWKQKAAWDKEDENMLIRLMKVRTQMWT